MTDILIRAMEHADLDQVIDIENVSYPAPWSRDSFVSELRNPLACYLIAEIEGVLVAYAGIWLIFDEIHITNVAVKPEQRGNRLGEILLLQMEQIAFLNQAVRVTLEVRPSNASALVLYERLGFKRVGLRKGYYLDNNEDAIIMTKELKDSELLMDQE